MKADICPVCNGSGKVSVGITENTSCSSTCHGCGGKGWVTVGTDDYLEVDEDGFLHKMSISTGAS